MYGELSTSPFSFISSPVIIFLNASSPIAIHIAKPPNENPSRFGINDKISFHHPL